MLRKLCRGSAQLLNHPTLRTGAIHRDDLLAAHGDDYLYLDAVRFVRRVKKGPLAETSPMLNDISGLPTWGKVNTGMLKMYEGEVLGAPPPSPPPAAAAVAAAAPG